MKDKQVIKESLEERIRENIEIYPFIANFWKIEVNEAESRPEKKMLSYGHFFTEDHSSFPFYKPFSKIIDFSKIDE